MNALYACITYKINNENMEKYDFETMNNSKVNPLAFERGGWTIVMYKMSDGDAYYVEIPPAPEFYSVYKEFHSNGMLKTKGKVAAQVLEIGVWQYYDKNGRLIKEVDKDKKFGNIKLDWLLKFIEKEGHINLSTGKGREYAVIEENGEGFIYSARFSIVLDEKGAFWVIGIEPDRENGFHRTIYHIDKNSGETLFKESTQMRPIK
jgi:hypothetical protein